MEIFSGRTAIVASPVISVGLGKETLVARFYLGDAVDYRVQCGENMIRVIVKGADVTAYPDGSKVYLDFDKTMVFGRD